MRTDMDDLEFRARPVSKLAEKNPAQEVFDKYKDKGAVLGRYD